MIRPIQFLEAAETEALDAFDWYEEQEVGLGEAFRKCVQVTISSIQDRPHTFPVVHGSSIRKAIVSRFPYVVFFSIQNNYILVYSIFHTSRHPMTWQGRV